MSGVVLRRLLGNRWQMMVRVRSAVSSGPKTKRRVGCHSRHAGDPGPSQLVLMSMWVLHHSQHGEQKHVRGRPPAEPASIFCYSPVPAIRVVCPIRPDSEFVCRSYHWCDWRGQRMVQRPEVVKQGGRRFGHLNAMDHRRTADQDIGRLPGHYPLMKASGQQTRTCCIESALHFGCRLVLANSQNLQAPSRRLRQLRTRLSTVPRSAFGRGYLWKCGL